MALVKSGDDAALGALAGEQLVGWVHVQGRRSLELEPFAEVCALVVDDGARGRGVGRKLMEAAEAWAKNQGYGSVFVRSNVKRHRAHSFYEGLGYTATKTSRVFLKTLE
jgi:GNAT superfamily N-acetyltransferase